MAIFANGNSFALGPKFERSKIKIIAGVQVDELDVKVYPEPADLVGSIPWLQAAWTGQFDGATLQVERAFMRPYERLPAQLCCSLGAFRKYSRCWRALDHSRRQPGDAGEC